MWDCKSSRFYFSVCTKLLTLTIRIITFQLLSFAVLIINHVLNETFSLFQTVELLCEKVLSSTNPIQSPGDAFRRVFESVASGLLLPDGPGLLDPCEKGSVDATAYLTAQQREDITAYAQVCKFVFNRNLILYILHFIIKNRIRLDVIR